MINNTQLWGILVDREPSSLYQQFATNNTLLIARNTGSDRVAFDSIASILDSTVQTQTTEMNHASLLHMFLEFHKLRRRENGTMDFCSIKIIILTVESYLTSEAEDSILLYMYLLMTGSVMPRLYVLMTCPVKAIIEPLTKIMRSAPIVEQPRMTDDPNSICVSDYHISPANYLDVAETTKGLQLILDPNNDELYAHVEDVSTNYIRKTSFEELIEYLPRATLVCLSPSIRLSVSSLYTGNKRVRKTVCDEYLLECIKLIRSVNTAIRVVIPREQGFSTTSNASFRESLTKDFSQDVVNFARSGLSLQLIYKYYSPDDTHIRARIAQTETMLERLAFLRRGKQPLAPESFLITLLRNHPVIAKIILLWVVKYKRPMFPIILFTAVIHSFERSTSETKEHGLKEIESDVSSICRYGEMMEKALSVIKRTKQCDSRELGRTGDNLKRLLTKAREYLGHMAVSDVQLRVGAFDLGRFTLLLGELLKAQFANEVLTRVPDGQKTGTVLFRNHKHPQIIWRVDNNPPFQEIFPIISMLERNGNRVLLYVPL
jgi:hypothetical protein